MTDRYSLHSESAGNGGKPLASESDVSIWHRIRERWFSPANIRSRGLMQAPETASEIRNSLAIRP